MDNNNCGIYIIKNIINNKVYIGQSIQLKKRINRHKRELRNNKHHNKYLQNSWDKYGKENFIFDILTYCSSEELDDLEIYYIELFNSTDYLYGYNDQQGGSHSKISEKTKQKISNTLKGNIISEETRMKISKANTGRKHTAEEKQKMSEARKGRPMLPHVKEALLKANLGRKQTKEHIGKRRIASIGRKNSQETIKLMSELKKGELNPFYNKHHSEETRKRMSISHQNKPRYDDLFIKNIRDDINNGMTYKELELKYNISQPTLTKIKYFRTPYNKEVI